MFADIVEVSELVESYFSVKNTRALERKIAVLMSALFIKTKTKSHK